MINDEESLLVSIKDYMKSNLNTEIAAINTEKGDFSTATITQDDKHYVIAGELLDLPNHEFVQIALGENIETNNNIDDISSVPIILIEVVFDNPKKVNTYLKSLRYMRAVYQTVVKYESSINEIGGLQITKAIPMIVANNRRELIVSGVEISVAIA